MLKLFSPLVFRILLFVMTWLVIILACMVYNPLSPKEYFNEMNRLETVQFVIEQSLVKKPIKQKNLKVKKAIKKIEYVKPKEEVITLPKILPDAWWEEIGTLVLDEPVVVKDKEYWRQRIWYWCGVHWISDWVCARAERIAKCESWFNPYAKYWYWANPNRVDENICVRLPDWRCSTAAWIVQRTKTSWASNSKRFGFEWVSRYDWDANIQVWILKMHHDGFSAWSESQKCRWR